MVVRDGAADGWFSADAAIAAVALPSARERDGPHVAHCPFAQSVAVTTVGSPSGKQLLPALTLPTPAPHGTLLAVMAPHGTCIASV